VIKTAALVFGAAALFLGAVLLGRLAVGATPAPRAIEVGGQPHATAPRRDRLGWTEVPRKVESGTLRRGAVR
jgi:hypothetical protein